MKPQILLILSLASSALAAPPLLPFQGHLTQSNGEAVEDGAKVVQFKIYDAPVSGNAVWAGEVHKLSVNKGLVNTILGTKTAFPPTYSEGAKVMFSEPLYIEITVDADDSQTITAADPPLLPRQVLLPANFAHVAHSVRAADGSEVIKENGEIDGSKLKPNSISPDSLNEIPLSKLGVAVGDGGIGVSQIGADAIGTSELGPDAVFSGNIEDGEVKEDDLDEGSVTAEKLGAGSVAWQKRAGRVVRTSTGVGNVPLAAPGEVAVSAIGGATVTSLTEIEIPAFKVDLETSGGVVNIRLEPSPGETPGGVWTLGEDGSGGFSGFLHLFRTEGDNPSVKLTSSIIASSGRQTSGGLAYSYTDTTAEAGKTYRYFLSANINTNQNSHSLFIRKMRMLAHEL